MPQSRHTKWMFALGYLVGSLFGLFQLLNFLKGLIGGTKSKPMAAMA